MVNTDASATAIAAILMQEYEGKEHPICYTSRTLNDAERRYSTIERECLAIVFAVKAYRNYLTGTHFVIVTDHRPLKYLLTIKDASSRLAKWAMFLMEYSFTIQYRKGNLNSNVDALTRLREETDEKEEREPPMIAVVTRGQELRPVSSAIWTKEEIQKLQQEDESIDRIKENLDNENSPYFIDDGIIYKQREEWQRTDRILAPKKIIPEILRIYHNTTQFIQDTLVRRRQKK